MVFDIFRHKRILLGAAAGAVAVILTAAFAVGTAAEETQPQQTEIPVFAYTADGEGCFDAEKVEADIRQLINRGYTPIFASQAAQSCHGGSVLPKKPVILSFGGDLSEYHSKLFPLLVRYRFKAVISVNGRQTEIASNSADDNTSHLRWEQIQQMHDSGLVEFSNGTFSYPDSDGYGQRENESPEEYRGRLIADIDRLQMLFKQYCGFEPKVFCYPGEANEPCVQAVGDLGFKAALCRPDDSATVYVPYRHSSLKIPQISANSIADIKELLK